MSDRTIGIGIIVVRGDKILIGKRGPDCKRGAGLWALPGGHLEPNEQIEECIKRELLEETGVKVRIPQRTFHESVFAVTDHLRHQSLNHLTFWALTFWDSSEAELKEPDKCTEWKWVTLDEIRDIEGTYDFESSQFYWLPYPLLKRHLCEIC